MELYGVYLAALVLFNVALAYHRHQFDQNGGPQESLALPAGDGKSVATKFKWEYFSLYSIVMAADWLQGPYLYTLYKDEKQIPESTVAALFTTGFVAAGITGSFVGALADQHGRRSACLVFCFTYGLSCLSVLSSDLFVLFTGRALGGLSTTLLYSVFETWMIAEYHKRDLQGCVSLGSMFSTSVTLSGVVAILAGVIGEAIVEATGTKTGPFMAAFACLALAFAGIYHRWSENYGETANEKEHTSEGVRSLLMDRRIVALGLTTTLFEGAMYLFVFFWSPALISSRAIASNSSSPPFGLIFSCFMCCMMLGSMIFSIAKPDNARDAGKLMLSILALASYGLLVPVLQRSEAATFWSFALFEVCVGLYFPSMSRLKSEIVEDAVRAKVYGYMRMPLNIFVVVALGVTKDGDAHRSGVFTTTGALLLAAFCVVQRYLL
ncbi:hypothetical protein LTR37_020088 [Vermiconidia calcicola]|uniref:Uncharacterized protein n=1 Tax=Vermiconidia calcicola TaxID=1690605 RepID=A0ACC3MDU3_9PEZI|nr:hypothetical protein LTR37_020088 [Vermiconidia calcicola]